MPTRNSAASSNSPGLFTPSQTGGGAHDGGWIYAHCDGGARGNPGPAGYGAQIKDAKDEVIAELSEFLGVRTNNYAEYSGLLGCLQWALDHRHPKLRLVSDSELMVKQIQGKYQVKSPDLKPLYEEAKRRIARLEGFEISHALRHQNKDADRLANQAMDRGTGDKGTGDRETRRGVPAGEPVAATSAHTPQARRAAGPAAPPIPIARPERPISAVAAPPADAMLRGFTRDGVVHVLGGAKLPDGVFVKIIRE